MSGNSRRTMRQHGRTIETGSFEERGIISWLKSLFSRPEPRSISRSDVWGDAADDREFGTSMRGALALIPVYAATNLISSEIASLPIQSFRRVGPSRERIDTRPIFEDPSIFGRRFEWVQRLLTSLLLRGNAYGLITVRDNFGFPRQIEWLHPDDVTLLDNLATTRPQFFWKGREVDMTSFIHIPAYVIPGEVLGLSPIGMFARTITTGLLAEKFGKDFFKNSSTPSGVLTTDQRVDEDQSNVIKTRFVRNTKNREPAVLGFGMNYRPITIMPNESQFLQTIQAKTNDIAAIYNIPAERIGGSTGSSRTYANREQDSQDLVTYTFRPWTIKIEGYFQQWSPEEVFDRFNFDALLRADLLTRYQAYSQALEDGWKNRDEIRILEDESPLPNGQGQVFATPPGLARIDPPTERAEVRALVTEDELGGATERMQSFFDAQREVVLDARAVDVERWNAELEPILVQMALEASEKAGRATMVKLAQDSNAWTGGNTEYRQFEYDPSRTDAWLGEQAAGVAQGVNETTADEVKTALDAEDSDAALRNVFVVAVSQRAERVARTHLTAATGFGQNEAARQSGLRATKTWQVTSGNPRLQHSAINGETRQVGELFSNGARWPGDSILSPDQRANCSCEMNIAAA